MARYALRVFGGPVLLSGATISVPPANITLYARGKGATNAVKVNVVSIDYFSPVFQGDTGNPLCIQVLHGDRSIFSLLGASISMEMQNTADLSIKACTGLWGIDSANTGKAFYPYQASDLNTVGSWYLWIKIILNGKKIHVDDGAGKPKILVIESLPVGV